MQIAACCWIAIVGLAVTLGGQTPPPRHLPPVGVTATSSSTLPASAVAVMTWVTRFGHDGVHTLELLVVWRGTPSWFARGGPHSGSGGGSGTAFHSSERFGDIELELDFDRVSRIVSIQGQKLNIGDSNILLVDGVDSAAGAKLATHLHVDPALVMLANGRPDIASVIKRSPEAVSFLQCDVPMSYGGRAGFVWPTCVSVRGD